MMNYVMFLLNEFAKVNSFEAFPIRRAYTRHRLWKTVSLLEDLIETYNEDIADGNTWVGYAMTLAKQIHEEVIAELMIHIPTDIEAFKPELGENEAHDDIPVNHRNNGKKFCRAYRRKMARKHGSDNLKNPEIIKHEYRRQRGWGNHYYNIDGNGNHIKKVKADKNADADIRQFAKDENIEVDYDEVREVYIQKLNHIKFMLWETKVDWDMVDAKLNNTIGKYMKGVM